MSVQKRKIGHWSIVFSNSAEVVAFDGLLLEKFVNYINQLPDVKKIINEEKKNKAVSIQKISVETKQNLKLIKFIFKSCKYNHSPKYMSSKDGSERKSNKKLFEGDKEITHMCMRIDRDEAYVVFEERRSGVNMG